MLSIAMDAMRSHLYERTLDPDGHDSLAMLARLIAPRTAVLDVGCGPGVLGEYLAAEKQCVVDGIELNPDAAARARRFYHQVTEGDLETMDLEAIGEQRYDCIVCADVLEHVRDPAAVARRLLRTLRPRGRMLLSIPNVSYSGLIAALIDGEFRYTHEGLLDNTHVRFFTRRSLVEWLGNVGLSAVHIDTVQLSLAESEFRGTMLHGMPPALVDALLSRPDALTYQFIVEAVVAGESPPETVAIEAPPASLTFSVQLYRRSRTGQCEEGTATRTLAGLAVDRQRVRLAIPPTQELAGLRLDPSDRPGLMRLYDLAAYDGAGSCLWRWDGTAALFADTPTHDLQLVHSDADGALVACGDDPFIELPLDGAALEVLQGGGEVAVELSWPASPDGVAVAERLFHREWQPARIAQLEHDLLHERRHAAEQRAAWDDARAKLVGQRDHLEHAVKQRDAELDALRHEHKRISELLERANNSLAFRVARPAFPIVNWIRGRLKRHE